MPPDFTFSRSQTYRRKIHMPDCESRTSLRNSVREIPLRKWLATVCDTFIACRLAGSSRFVVMNSSRCLSNASSSPGSASNG